MGNTGFWVSAWGACGLLIASIVYDCWLRRIPNAIPALLLGAFALYGITGSIASLNALWVHLGVAAVLLAAGFALYLSGCFGAGDGKLLPACGLWAGPEDLSLFLFGLGACSLALSLFALLPFEQTRSLRSELPFAVAIAPPTVLVLLQRMLAHIP